MQTLSGAVRMHRLGREWRLEAIKMPVHNEALKSQEMHLNIIYEKYSMVLTNQRPVIRSHDLWWPTTYVNTEHYVHTALLYLVAILIQFIRFIELIRLKLWLNLKLKMFILALLLKN